MSATRVSIANPRFFSSRPTGKTAWPGPQRQGGFTYVILLILVAALGAGMAAFGELYSRSERREKERELLDIGNEFRRAIASYYQVGRTYPKALEELVEDKRFSPTRRHLRRLYRDPLTASSDWGLVQAPNGGIMGVHSLAEEEPLKSGNFAERDAEFAGAASYRDWSFTYRP